MGALRGGRSSREPRLSLAFSLALTAVTLAAFWGVRRAGFVFDDEGIILQNSRLTAGLTVENIRWAFTSVSQSNWHPLTWLSHLATAQAFGLEPGPHHLVNLVLHLLAALALFLVLRALTGATVRSAVVAALFAVHPLRVESVAWVTERKDTLSALWWMLGIGAHLSYVRRPSLSRYLALVGALALGLMSKAMVVTLPAVLLLLDVWPLGRLRPGQSGRSGAAVPGAATLGRLVLEKVPLAAIAAIAAVIAFVAQRSGRAVMALELLSPGERVANALLSSIVYLRQTLWPLGLGVYYPLPLTPPGSAEVLGAFLVIAGATFLAARLYRRAPFFAVGWLWYLVALIPVIGIVQVGGQAHADRYTYLPLVGPVIALVWGAEALTRGVRRRGVLLAVPVCAALVALVVLCRAQVGYWRDDLSLYRRTLQVTKDNWMIRNNLGKAHVARGELEPAIAEFRESLLIKPSFVLARYNLAATLSRQGRAPEALQEYRTALIYNPLDPDVHAGLADLLERQGDGSQALWHYQHALEVRPQSADLHLAAGVLFLKGGNVAEASRHFREGVRVAPSSAVGHMNLGTALARLGETEEARVHYLEALRLDPLSPGANYNYANFLLAEGKPEAAAARYREALRLSPDLVDARLNLGSALYDAGRPLEALREYEEAVRLAPASAEALANLGAVLIGLGRTREAVPHLRQALLLRPDLEPARRALESIAGSGAQ